MQTNLSEKYVYSDKYVRLVDIVFGVVVAQSTAKHSEILFAPQAHPLDFAALLGIYLTVILSWVGYHGSVTKFPYSEAWVGTLRLFADFGIVIVYVYLLRSIAPNGVVLDAYLRGFLLVFVMWIVSGLLRMAEHGKSASKPGLLFACCFVSLGLWWVYQPLVLRYSGCQAFWDWLFLCLPVIVMVLFRVIRPRWRWL